MKTLTTIQDFLKTNPTKEEVEKVMKVINNLNFRKIKKEIWTLQTKFNKLSQLEKKMKELEISIPDTITDGLKDLKSQVEVLRKGIPEVKKKVTTDIKK